MKRYSPSRDLLTLLLYFLSSTLSAQPPHHAKCSPALQTEYRSAEPERFVVVASDLPAFERRLAEVAPQTAVLHTYPPAGIAVLVCPRARLLENC